MKKYIVLCLGACMALSFTSCRSGESAYKKAYEKAKSQEASMRTNESSTPTTTDSGELSC